MLLGKATMKGHSFKAKLVWGSFKKERIQFLSLFSGKMSPPEMYTFEKTQLTVFSVNKCLRECINLLGQVFLDVKLKGKRKYTVSSCELMSVAWDHGSCLDDRKSELHKHSDVPKHLMWACWEPTVKTLGILWVIIKIKVQFSKVYNSVRFTIQ